MSTAETPGSPRVDLQGSTVTAEDRANLLAGLDTAFDYRGDVTLTLTDGRTVEGYIFDRRRGDSLETSAIRMIPKDSDNRLTITYAQIKSLQFTGKDTAAGRSWETWVKKYVEKKLKGEKADIHSESLD